MKSDRAYFRLATNGFLPKEIPPAFSSRDLGRFKPPAGEWYDTLNKSTPTRKLDSTEKHQVGISMPRAGMRARRNASVPSPIAYLRIARLLNDNWAEVRSKIRASNISLSKAPLLRKKGTRAIGAQPEGQVRQAVAMSRSAMCRNYVYLDVANFYGSIYTHAVDWAIRGKAAAKDKRREKCLGSFLDRALQDCNDDQTSGIAVGPDTSRVVSELLAAAVDSQVQDRLPDLGQRCLRVFDDVWFYGRSHSEAEDFLRLYTGSLETFGLRLNSEKVEFADGHKPISPPWLHLVRTCIRDAREAANSSRLADVYESVLQIHEDHPGASLGYFLSALRFPDSLSDTRWRATEDFLSIAARREPSTLAHLHRFLVYASSSGLMGRRSRSRSEERLSEFVGFHSGARQPLEVATAINTLNDLDIPLDAQLARTCTSLENDFVDLLVLESAEDYSPLASIADDIRGRGFSENAFLGGHWLLAYEVQSAEARGTWTQEMRQGCWPGLADQDIHFIRRRRRQGGDVTRDLDYRDRLKIASVRSDY